MRKIVTLLVMLAATISLQAQVRAKVNAKRNATKVVGFATTTSHSVSLTWLESATGVTFNVYRGTAAGGEVAYASGVATLSFTDNAVTNGQTYFYFVTAVGTGGESAPSNEVSAQIPSPPPAPTALAATVH